MGWGVIGTSLSLRIRRRGGSMLGVTIALLWLGALAAAPAGQAQRARIAPRAAIPGPTFVFQSGGVNFQLYEASADGSNAHQITFAGSHPALFAEHPAVSPDGTKLAYQVSDAGVGSGKDGIYVSNVDGGGAHQIMALDHGMDIAGDPLDSEVPTWSPDGSLLMISRSSNLGHEQLWVVSAAGGNAQLLSPDSSISDEHPRWSTAGVAFNRIVAGQPTQVWTAQVTGTATGLALTNLVQVTHDTTGADVEPTWAPDGTQIAYSRTNGDGTANSGNAAVIGKVRLGANGTGGSTQVLSTSGGYDQYPSWSPDGSLIVFDRLGIGSDGTPDYSNTGTLETVSADGGTQQALPSPANILPQAPQWLRPPPPPAPVLGKVVTVAPTTGQVLVKLPGAATAGAARAAPGGLAKGNGFIPLTVNRRLPVGSQIDARAGTLRLTAATGKVGKTQAAMLSKGLFSITQSTTGVAKGLTTFSLLENLFPGAPSFSVCTAAAARSRAHVARPSPTVIQLLHAKDKGGSFRTRGRNSAGTARGTEWDTIDRCDGTLTVVRRGTVLVADPRRRVTVTVHAGHRYLAKLPGA